MKLFVIAASLLFSLNLAAETLQMCPMWEEDAHFQRYRCLMIESAVSRIEEQLQDMDIQTKNKIQDEINVIKLNLGYPVYFKDLSDTRP